MMKFAAICLTSLLAQGILAADSPDQNPNSAVYTINGNEFLHHNAGVLYGDMKKRNPNLPPVKGGAARWSFRGKNFEEYHKEQYIHKEQYVSDVPSNSISIFPREGKYLSFNWEKFQDEKGEKDDRFGSYIRDRFDYTPVVPSENKGDYMPESKKGRNKNHIYFFKQEAFDKNGKVNMVKDERGETVPDERAVGEPIATGFDIAYNEMDFSVWSHYSMGFACIDRASSGGKISVDSDGLPLNPKGVTGTGMKFSGLWRYGVNQAADPIVMRRTGKDTFEVIMIIRNKDNSVGIPGGMVDPGQTYGRTLLKELGEEAVKLDKGPDGKSYWKSLSAEKQTDYLTTYIADHFSGLMLYKGYSDDDRNSDNSWVETTCAMYMDTSTNNEGSKKLKLRKEDTEKLTSGTFWLTMEKEGDHYEAVWPEKIKPEYQFMFASHKFLIEDACRYAEMCFDYKDGKMVEKDDVDGRCQRGRDAFQKISDNARTTTEACQRKSKMATCCLWTDRYCNEEYVKNGVTKELKNKFKEAIAINNGEFMPNFQKFRKKWEQECKESSIGEEEKKGPY